MRLQVPQVRQSACDAQDCAEHEAVVWRVTGRAVRQVRGSARHNQCIMVRLSGYPATWGA